MTANGNMWARASRRRYRPLSRSAAFSLVEAMVALTLLSIAGAALLLATQGTVSTAQESYETTVAAGIARQLMEEIVSRRYREYGASPTSSYVGPGSWESSGGGRERFDDIDDYESYTAAPPEDLWGVPLGTGDGEGGVRHPLLQIPTGLLDDFNVRIRVRYSDAADLSRLADTGVSTEYRRIRVKIYRRNPDGGTVQLVNLKRTVSYTGMDQW